MRRLPFRRRHGRQHRLTTARTSLNLPPAAVPSFSNLSNQTYVESSGEREVIQQERALMAPESKRAPLTSRGGAQDVGTMFENFTQRFTQRHSTHRSQLLASLQAAFNASVLGGGKVVLEELSG